MKANEFIKKNGLEAAKKILSMRGGFRGFITLTDGSSLHSDELQKLVESHELVESIGGIEFAKNFIKVTGSTLNNTLEKAIADVESCGGERG